MRWIPLGSQSLYLQDGGESNQVGSLTEESTQAGLSIHELTQAGLLLNNQLIDRSV